MIRFQSDAMGLVEASRCEPTEKSTMANDASELALRLACHAEAVCRHYLSNDRREGRYWRVGNVHNTPGRSLFVRLIGAESGKGAAGKWTDGANGRHGDLLDIIVKHADSLISGMSLKRPGGFLAYRDPS